jgi:hypothetical protein
LCCVERRWRGGIDPPRGVESTWGWIEPSLFTLKHVEKKQGGIGPSLFMLKWVGGCWTLPGRVKTRQGLPLSLCRHHIACTILVRDKNKNKNMVGAPGTSTPMFPSTFCYCRVVFVREVWDEVVVVGCHIINDWSVDGDCDWCDRYARWVLGDCDVTRPDPGYHLILWPDINPANHSQSDGATERVMQASIAFPTQRNGSNQYPYWNSFTISNPTWTENNPFWDHHGISATGDFLELFPFQSP